MTESILDRIGSLIDTADNYLVYGNLNSIDNPFPDAIRIDAMTHGLEEIRDELRAIYFKLGGEDVWTSP